MDAHDTGLTGVYHKPLRSESINWQGQAVSLVSLGCAQPALLDESACAALHDASVIFGSKHHFAAVKHLNLTAQCVAFPSPFNHLSEQLAQQQTQRVVVLASGDGLFYGVGAWLLRKLGRHNLRFFPNVSSVQASFHAIGLPWQAAKVVSLHGRDLSHLRRHLINRTTLALLTDALAHPGAIARELVDQGFEQSNFWVCEAMGSSAQQVTATTAAELARQSKTEQSDYFHPLNVCVVHLTGSAPHLPAFPGIADEHFSTGSSPGRGMISKRETRLAILALMDPTPGEIAWDLGAGCGSVSVEWARFNARGTIYAVEHNDERVAHIHTNSDRFGTVLNLHVVNGSAPLACDTLPDPHAVFVGGNDGALESLLTYVWRRLPPLGKLVASAVTDDSERVLDDFYETAFAKSPHNAAFSKVTLSVTKNLPGSVETRSLAPVTLYRCIKS